jgi:hypothetical protein
VKLFVETLFMKNIRTDESLQPVDYIGSMASEFLSARAQYVELRRILDVLRADRAKVQQRTELLKKLLELEGENVDAA